MKIVGYDNTPKEDLPPSEVDMWYNRSERSWVIQLRNIEGNQIGDADYIHNKQDALKRVEDYKDKYGIQLRKIDKSK